MKGEFAGSFNVTSGKIVISDPCYDWDIVNSNKSAGQMDAKNGEWVGEIYYADYDSKVSHLICYHKKHPILRQEVNGSLTPFRVAVDSGQAGVFDSASYKNDSSVEHLTDANRKYKGDRGQVLKICPNDPWYSWACDATLSENPAGFVPHGVVSSTGYGDGSYDCRVVKNEELVVGVIIEFIGEEDEDEWAGTEYDEYYDD